MVTAVKEKKRRKEQGGVCGKGGSRPPPPPPPNVIHKCILTQSHVFIIALFEAFVITVLNEVFGDLWTV